MEVQDDQKEMPYQLCVPVNSLDSDKETATLGFSWLRHTLLPVSIDEAFLHLAHIDQEHLRISSIVCSSPTHGLTGHACARNAIANPVTMLRGVRQWLATSVHRSLSNLLPVPSDRRLRQASL